MNPMKSLRFPSHAIIGNGSIGVLPAKIKEMNRSNILIVTDPGLAESGMIESVKNLLDTAALSYCCFDQVTPEPHIETAVRATDFALENSSDLILGIGGGSSLDVAKAVSVLLTNRDGIHAYLGVDQVSDPGAGLILVPTTSGTGSEATPIAVLSDHAEMRKKAIVSHHLYPDLAIVDPELTVGLPAAITASTGMDALIHAIEAYTSKDANSLTDMFAKEAIGLIAANIRAAYANGQDIDARAKMSEGSFLAGVAFANAGVSAVHAFSYAIGIEFSIPHGVANSMMLVPVIRFNMLANMAKYSSICGLLGENVSHLSLRNACEMTVKTLHLLVKDLHIPRLSDFGATKEHIPILVDRVLQEKRLLSRNPREMTAAGAADIYRMALHLEEK